MRRACSKRIQNNFKARKVKKPLPLKTIELNRCGNPSHGQHMPHCKRALNKTNLLNFGNPGKPNKKCFNLNGIFYSPLLLFEHALRFFAFSKNNNRENNQTTSSCFFFFHTFAYTILYMQQFSFFPSVLPYFYFICKVSNGILKNITRLQ